MDLGKVSPRTRRLALMASLFWIGLFGGCAPEQAEQSPNDSASGGALSDTASEPATPTAPSAPSESEKTAASVGALPPDGSPPPSAPRAGGFEPADSIRREPERAGKPEPSGQARVQWGSSGPSPDSEAPWRPLAYDGIHDASSEAVDLLQEPRSALRGMPRANAGNFVDWVAALRDGLIRPRARVGSSGEMELRETDILFADTRTMPVVIFPHRAHTEWLACGNCHDWLFEARRGANQISMTEIARGRACGLCHGKVAFPPTECFRCHSGPRPQS